jgi:translation elongation factor EF-Tu-like GTPase
MGAAVIGISKHSWSRLGILPVRFSLDAHHLSDADQYVIGTGKGGQSIYGQPFEDEIRPTLKVRLTSFAFVLHLTDVTKVQRPWDRRLRECRTKHQ